MRISGPFAVAVFSMAAAGCNGDVAAGGGGTTTATSAILSGYTLSYVQTGGFAATYVAIDVDDTAKTISRASGPGATPKTASLSDAERSTLAAAVAVADLPHHAGPYPCGQCADQFLYDVTLKTGGTVYKVHWEDGSGAPQGLFDLGKALRDMALAKLP